jgi:hypothetical protein
MGDAVNLLKSGIETADKIALSPLSKEQMTHEGMIQSGISFVLESNLSAKAG